MRYVAAHQPFHDEDAARGFRFVGAVVPRPAQQLHAEQAQRLHRRDLAALRVPHRILQHALHQVRRDLGQPGRLDRGIDAGEQLAGLRQLRAHQPVRRLLRQHRAGEDAEAAAARAVVLHFLRRLLADVVDQAGEQGLVQGHIELVQFLRRGGLAGGPELALVARRQQVGDLPVHRFPLLHAQVGDVVFLTAAAQLAVGQFLAPLLPAPPQLQQAEEVGLRVLPLGVLSTRGGLRVRRHLVRVLHRQSGGQHPDLLVAGRATPGEGDAGDARVQRQAPQLAAQRGQAALLIERAEVLQQAVAFRHMAAFRSVEPGKVLDIAQAKRRHLQDHAGQVGAQDFRIAERRALGEVLLRVQAQRHAGTDAAAAAGALVGGGLRDRLDVQLLHAQARRVAIDAGGAGVDHVADARHRDRGFGDVGREHDARGAARGGEHPVLLLRRQARVQRQHLGARKAAGQRARQLVDLALARQEHQGVAALVAAP